MKYRFGGPRQRRLLMVIATLAIGAYVATAGGVGASATGVRSPFTVDSNRDATSRST